VFTLGMLAQYFYVDPASDINNTGDRSQSVYFRRVGTKLLH
jgi:hypothetical protein